MKAEFKVDMHKIFGLTLDGRLYSCHLGCNSYVTYSRTDMARHLLENHSEEQLRLWHIPPNLLLKIKLIDELS